MAINGVIFDLDGVIVSTDECHYKGWKRLAEDVGLNFTKEDNLRLRGVSRMESLDIILEKSEKTYSSEEKIDLATRKNDYYLEMLKDITPDDILPGINSILAELKKRNIKIAIGSSSRNTPTILKRIGLDDCFDAVADGNDISKGKPDPEVFLIAAKRINLPPADCLVVEDAEAGVSAALNGGMPVLAVGAACNDQRAQLKASDMSKITVEDLLGV